MRERILKADQLHPNESLMQYQRLQKQSQPKALSIRIDLQIVNFLSALDAGRYAVIIFKIDIYYLFGSLVR